MSDRGHWYILTFVVYATRYPEAVALKNINTEAVTEAMLCIFSRVGVPEEVPSDQGEQFMSECMQEISRLSRIRRVNNNAISPDVQQSGGTVQRNPEINVETPLH